MADERADGADETGAVERVKPRGEASLPRRLAAEFLGTLLLVAVGSGAATILALGPAESFDDLATGQALSGAPPEQAVFQSLLGNNLGDLLPVAFAFAIILATLVYALGGVSGGHFNPAVTLALASIRRFRWQDVPLYWVVQVLGGIAGAVVIAGIYGEVGAIFTSTVPTIDPATGQPAGSTDVTTQILFGATRVDVEFWRGVLSEAFITFILVTAVMAVAVDPRAPKGWSGLVIGLALAGGILVTGEATGGSANFARSLGPLVVSLPYDVGKIPWGDLGVYALGPALGAVAAAFVYEGVTGLERVSPSPSPGAATPEPEALLVEDEDIDDDTPSRSGATAEPKSPTVTRRKPAPPTE